MGGYVFAGAVIPGKDAMMNCWTSQGRPSSRWIVTAIVLALLAVAGPRTVLGQGPPASAVVVEAVQLEPVEERRLVTGELRSLRRTHVASLEEGRVIELPVVEGDIVEAGDVLARLDDVRLRLDLTRLESELAIRKAARAEREALLEQAKRDEANLEDLLAKSSAARQEYDDAVSERLAAQARLEQAVAEISYTQAQIDLLRERLDDMVIRAPFRASVVRKLAEVGDWIGAGDAVVEAIDTNNMEARLAVPEQYTAALNRPDLAIPLQLRAVGKRLSGLKPRLVRQVDPEARTLSLIIPIKAEDEDLLAPGMSVTAWIPTGRDGEYLLVPRDALLQNAAGYFAYVVSEGEAGMSAMPRQLEVVFETDGSVAVRPGSLQPGDPVVVEGNERLYPTAPVQVVQRSQPESEPAASAGAGEESQG